MCKSVFVCAFVLAWLAVSAFVQPLPVAAQTPTPDTSPTLSRPDFDHAIAELNAQPTSDPSYEAWGEAVAARYGPLLDAQVIQVHVFVVPPATTFEKIVEVYQTVFGQAGWQVSETTVEKTETYSTMAWTDRHNVFLIYHQPASQAEDTAVLATVNMLVIPELPGIEPVDGSDNPALAAIADQVAQGITGRTGAQTEVKMMTVSADVPITEILSFYDEAMIEAGWSPVDAFTQADDKFSSMGWLRDHTMLIIFITSVSQNAADKNLLLWIVARLPTSDVSP